MGPVGFQSRSLLCGKLLSQVVVENWDVKSVWRNDVVDCFDYIASMLGERKVLMDRCWRNTGCENGSPRIYIPIPMPISSQKIPQGLIWDWTWSSAAKRTCLYMYVRTYVFIYSCMYVCTHMCMYACMYVCMYMYACMCTCMCDVLCTYAWICIYRPISSYM
jgi:hypothetical protein